jgi:hypothetical protein
MVEQFILPGISALGAIGCFLAACFPRWRLWWGRTESRPGDRVPVSTQGRVAFGFFFTYIAAVALFRTALRSFWYLVIIVALMQIAGLCAIYVRDRRRHEEDGHR